MQYETHLLYRSEYPTRCYRCWNRGSILRREFDGHRAFRAIVCVRLSTTKYVCVHRTVLKTSWNLKQRRLFLMQGWFLSEESIQLCTVGYIVKLIHSAVHTVSVNLNEDNCAEVKICVLLEKISYHLLNNSVSVLATSIFSIQRISCYDIDACIRTLSPLPYLNKSIDYRLPFFCFGSAMSFAMFRC